MASIKNGKTIGLFREIDPYILRNALLFCEQIATPTWVETNQEYNIATPYAENFNKININIEPLGDINHSDLWEEGLGHAYADLDKREPGAWSLWLQSKGMEIPSNFLDKRSAIALHLSKAIILPHREVALEDVVNFRLRKSKEMREFRSYIENIAWTLSNNNLDAIEIRRMLEIFSGEILAFNSVMSEPNWKKVVGSLKVSFNVTDAVKHGIGVATAISVAGGSMSAVIVGSGSAIASSISVAKENGFKGKLAGSPFLYISQVENELY